MHGPACLPIGTSDRSEPGLTAAQPRKANGFKTIQKMSVAHDGGRILPRPDRPSHFSSPSAAAAASSFLLRVQRNQNVSSVFELDAVHNLFEDEKRHATIKNYPRNTCNARRVWNADYLAPTISSELGRVNNELGSLFSKILRSCCTMYDGEFPFNFHSEGM